MGDAGRRVAAVFRLRTVDRVDRAAGLPRHVRPRHEPGGNGHRARRLAAYLYLLFKGKALILLMHFLWRHLLHVLLVFRLYHL